MSPDPVCARAHARAGLLGNPSDGYGGKAIALSLYDFRARVRVRAADRCEIRPHDGPGLEFPGLGDAARAFRAGGCDGGARLVHAALARFAGHPRGAAALARGGARLRCRLDCDTTIPREVGLAGSSAIVIATLRALCAWLEVEIPRFDVAELALAAEVEGLGIAAGAMDRVIQTYEGFWLMDLREPRSERHYRRLDRRLLPPLFVAWDPRGGTASGVAHGDLRARWLRRDPEVLRAVEHFRELVDRGVACIERGDAAGLRALVDENFEARKRIFPVSGRDRELVAIARGCGAAAKQCGSGGAVIGIPPERAALGELASAYAGAGFAFVEPTDAPRPEVGA
jgi:glucuronokinase